MKKVLLAILFGAMSVGVFAADGETTMVRPGDRTSLTDAVLMTIDGKPVMASEFLYIYEKNNQETTIDQKSIEEYLDLFINFKLKVAEAEAQGIDTTEAFLKELKGYRAGYSEISAG